MNIERFPLHPFVTKYLMKFLESKKDDEYLFGDSNGKLHQKKAQRAIIQFYNMITHTTGKKKDVSKELQDKVISFYSFRHTFKTMCVLFRYNDVTTERTDDIIDYFMRHKISNKMRANYSHINQQASARSRVRGRAARYVGSALVVVFSPTTHH